MREVLEKQPKTKACLLKTKGPTLYTVWHSLSELEFKIELLE
jgi:hypothetical protein